MRVAVNEQNLNTRFALRNRKFGSSSMTPRRHEPTKRHETPMEIDKFSGSCFNCGRKGHRATECRRPKQVNAVKAVGKSPFCWDCGKTGHTRQGRPGQRVTDRRHPKTIPKLQGEGTRNLTCWDCGLTGHTRQWCPENIGATVTCWSCGQQGHTRKDCNQPLN